MKKTKARGALHLLVKKLLLIMRLTIFLIIVSVFASTASVYSQSTKLTLKMKNTRIADVFDAIEQQSEFYFFYNRDNFDDNRRVSVDIEGKTIDDILDDLFKNQDVTYEIVDRNILIKTKNEIFDLLYTPQQKSVSGKVTDENGESLPGVTVLIKGTTNGTVTNMDGEYTITNLSEKTTLQFSFVGMKTKEVAVQGKSTIDVTMEVDAIGIEEVVAIGYGTMKKSDLTGSIVQVQADKLEKSSPATVQDILRSGVPGVISSMSNSAEGGGSLLIRGERSLAAGTDPLIVVDGVIFSGNLLEINPKDIEKIDVLKDASAAAVYGAKSANGVIIITTKRGKKGKPTINFDSSIGVVTMAANRKVYGPEGFLQYRSDLFNSTNNFENSAAYYNPTDDLLNKYGISIEDWRAYSNATSTDDEATWLDRIGLGTQEIENYQNGKTYDWYDASFQTGIKQNYSFNFSGATDYVNYYFSIGYLNSEGIIVGDEYQNFRTNLKLDANVTSFWQVGVSAKLTDRTSDDEATAWSSQAVQNTPFSLPYDEDGNLNPYPMGETSLNPGYNQAYINKYKDTDSGSTALNASIWSKFKLPFGITYECRFSPRFNWYYYRYWQSSEYVKDTYNGYVKGQTNKYINWYLDNIITWEHDFNKHHFNVTLLQNAEDNRKWSETMVAYDFTPSDALGWHYVTSAANKNIETEDTRSTGDALMGRLFYSYDNRYMATMSIRRDGFSAFGSNYKRANFPSVALAWVFTKEKFFNWATMSNGKLRMSWGMNGNNDIGIYQALSNLTTGYGKYVYGDANGATTEVSSLYVSRMANDDLRWEKTTSWNAGLDFGFFKNRLNGSVDYYYMPTTDLLMARSLPGFTGYSSITCNLGEVQNSGFEMSLNSVNVQNKNLRWSTTFSFSTNKNKIKHLYYTYEDITDEDGVVIGQKEVDDSSNGWFIGKDINEIWDYEGIGIWQEDEAEEAALYGQQPGDAKCLDVNGDYSLTTDDKVFLGSTSPKFRWAMRNDFEINKRLSVSVNVYSYWGHKATTTSYLHYSGADAQKTNAYVEEYWTPDNPSNRYARLNSTLPSNVSPKLIMDKSFIRLDNISLSYDVPTWIANKIEAKNIRLYGSIQNVAVWSKEWEYWDPEITGPTPRTFTLGATLTF